MPYSEVVDQLTIDTAKMNRTDVLKEIDKLLFPDGSTSILHMNADQVNVELEKAIKSWTHKSTLTGGFINFAKQYGNDAIKIEYTDTVQGIVKKINQSKELIKKNLQ